MWQVVAHQRAARLQKVVVIDFVVSCCAPCQRMGETTRTDEDIGRWTSSRGLAVQIDLDEKELWE